MITRSSFKRRRKPVRVYTAVFFVVLISLTYFFLTRPASIFIESKPEDSLINFDGAGKGIGHFELDDLKPGSYQVRITRKGYESVVRKIELRRGQKASFRFVLRPLPQKIRITTHPEKARFKIDSGGKKIIEGVTPADVIVPSGKTILLITRSGYNALSENFLVDEPAEFEYWLDRKGQIVRCLRVFKCGPAPKGLSFTPDRKELWVTMLGGPPSVEIYDPVSGRKLEGIKINNHGAVEVIFNRKGTRAYVSQMETASVFEIDVGTRKILRKLSSESAWSKVVALSPDEKTLFVSNWSGNDISEIDLEKGKLKRRIPSAKTPRGMYVTPDGKYLYVAGFGRGEIDKINLESGNREMIFKGGVAIRHLVGDSRRGVLYASDMGKNCIWQVNLKNDRVSFFVKTDNKPNTIDLSADGKVLFVSCRGANNPKSYYLPGPEWGSVLLIDTSTGKLLDAIVGGNQCTALDVSNDGKMLAFSDFLDNRIRIYRIPSYEILVKGKGGRGKEHLKELKKR